MGSEYTAEVSLSYRYPAGEYEIVVDGRADGIIDGDLITIDEIKGTYRDLDRNTFIEHSGKILYIKEKYTEMLEKLYDIGLETKSL